MGSFSKRYSTVRMQRLAAQYGKCEMLKQVVLSAYVCYRVSDRNHCE